jgi:hypothetical protein
MSSHQLLRAAKHGHSDRMTELLGDGANVESTDSVRYDVIFWRAIFSIFHCVLSVCSIDDELDVKNRRMPSSWVFQNVQFHIQFESTVKRQSLVCQPRTRLWECVGIQFQCVTHCILCNTHSHTRTGRVFDADVDRSLWSRGLRAAAAGCRR